jgi:hypothetical protein
VTLLTGNLFYGNTAPSGPVVYRYNGTITSYGYNVVDVALSNTNSATTSGFAASTINPDTDKTISVIPISPVNFRLLIGSDAANVIDILPEGYPSRDFYGTAITAAAAAGAVQTTVSGGGYTLNLSVNVSAYGNISANPAPNADGLVSAGNITITATVTEGCELAHWLVNGTNAGNTNPLQLSLTNHTNVQAVFIKTFVVTNFSDASGSATVAGTLRHAMTNALDGDIVRLSGVTPGTTSIALTARLPDITKSITIEGNGVTLTQASTYTASATSQLMYINSASAEVTISRIWFKDGRATDYGALRINAGTLTLESCIFSGHHATVANASGGAIYRTGAGTLNVKGCTFYNNSSAPTNNGYGGAIYVASGTLTLAGNLFYENTAVNGPVVRRGGGTVTSLGYNVVDMAIGAANDESGFASATGDTTIEALLGSNTTTPFANAATLAPKSELSIIPADFAGNMPATDFYGVARTWPGAGGAVK